MLKFAIVRKTFETTKLALKHELNITTLGYGNFNIAISAISSIFIMRVKNMTLKEQYLKWRMLLLLQMNGRMIKGKLEMAQKQLFRFAANAEAV